MIIEVQLKKEFIEVAEKHLSNTLYTNTRGRKTTPEMLEIKKALRAGLGFVLALMPAKEIEAASVTLREVIRYPDQGERFAAYIKSMITKQPEAPLSVEEIRAALTRHQKLPYDQNVVFTLSLTEKLKRDGAFKSSMAGRYYSLPRANPKAIQIAGALEKCAAVDSCTLHETPHILPPLTCEQGEAIGKRKNWERKMGLGG